MIPPSILMILYGLITSQPISKLLVGGVVPGVLSAVAYGVGIQVAGTRQASPSSAAGH